MKVAEGVLAACVAVLAVFVGFQTRQLSSTNANANGVTDSSDGAAIAPAISDSALTPASPGSNPYQRAVARSRDLIGAEMALPPRELRRRIDQGATGTYIRELLQSRDSSLARWPVRIAQPLRVWIAEPVQLDGWNEQFPSSVRDAFDTWVEAGVPMRFTYVYDSASADVHVRFLPNFPTGISGKTLWTRDTRWWLIAGDVILSLTHPKGGPVTAAGMRAIALHEVGHLLGLDHTSDPANIMSARIRVRDLSDADRATIRLLYSVPAGSARDSVYQRTTSVRSPD